jgi:carbon-monoxide dehydrogenase small subunit
VKIQFQLNGTATEVEASPWRRLLDLLREDLGLTGSKEGCGEGECGACTVLVDGTPANACLMLASQVHGHNVTTVEGLADGSLLNEVQDALLTHGGAQCGICTPGIAVCASWAVDAEPDADRERIRELLSGNLCRCTGYQLIVDAISDAAHRRSGKGGDA